MRNKNLGIRLKFSLIIIIPILLTFILISYSGYVKSRKALTHRIKKFELPYYADNASNAIAMMMSNANTAIEVIKTDYKFKYLLTQPNVDSSVIENYLVNLTHRYNINIIGFISEKKQMYYSNGEKPHHISPETDSWYYRFKQTPFDHENNIDFDYYTKTPFLWINQKIYDNQNNLIGVAFVGIDLTDVKKFVLKQNYAGNGSSMLIDTLGSIKVYSDTSKIDFNNLHDSTRSIKIFPVYRQHINKILSKQSFIFLYKSNNRRHIVVTRYIKDLNWILLIDVDLDKVVIPFKKILWHNILIGIVASLILILLVIWLNNIIVIKPLFTVVHGVKKMRDGELSFNIDLKQRDELGVLANSIEEMRRKLKSIILKIKEASDTVDTVGKDIQNIAEELAASSEEQASSIEELSATMEEINVIAEKNVEISEETNEFVEQTIDATFNAFEYASKITSKIEEITSKLKVMEEIAEKIDILAINASIEAAHAGDYGKGFRVVASEIKKLAEFSKQAVRQLNDFSTQINEISASTIHYLNIAKPNIKKYTEKINIIATSSKEQNTGITGVNEAINQLNYISTINASTANKLSEKAKDLYNEMGKLIDEIKFFKTTRD